MRFSRLIQGELPFTLNIPTGTYAADVAGIPTFWNSFRSGSVSRSMPTR